MSLQKLFHVFLFILVLGKYIMVAFFVHITYFGLQESIRDSLSNQLLTMNQIL